MTVQKISATLAVALSLGIAATGVCREASASAAGVAKVKVSKNNLGKSQKKEQSSPAIGNGAYDGAVRGTLKQLTLALANSDAKTLSSLWLEDGTYSNEIGQEWKGRSALEKRFTAVFAAEGRLLLDFIPVTIRQLADNVATVDGFVKFKDEVIGAPDTRFSIVMQKQPDGNWLIVSANETPFVDSERQDHLKPLAWLIGNWEIEKNGATMVVKAEWAGNKKFIHLRYMLKKDGAEVLDSQQIIGWDPRRDQIVSWMFDSRGGFGTGVWSQLNSQWLIDSDGVDPDGRVTSATNIISSQTANSFSWQSVNRSVEGESFSDTAQLTINRR